MYTDCQKIEVCYDTVSYYFILSVTCPVLYLRKVEASLGALKVGNSNVRRVLRFFLSRSASQVVQ